MGKTIAIINQKGGVAKTTTVVNLASALAERGKKVLVVDLDPQGNATSGLGIIRQDLEVCVYDILINEVPLDDVRVKTEFFGVDLVPTTINLAGAEIELVSAMCRENKLRKALLPEKQKYDYILIDCPPSLGLLTLNALTAATDIIIPVQCEYYALEGLGQLLNTYKLVKKHLNNNLELLGVLLTMYDNRTNLSADVKAEVDNYFGKKVFKTVIHRNVKLSEAPSHGMPINVYDSRSKGAKMYAELAKEVVVRG